MVCLLLAIPSTIAYKIAIGPLPKEDKGYRQLVKPDVLRGALDLRMGRIKSGETLGEPIDRFVPSNFTSFSGFRRETRIPPNNDVRHPTNMSITEERGTAQMNLINFNQTHGDKSPPHRTEISGLTVDKAVAMRTRGWWVEVGKPGSKILGVFFPVGSAIYTAGYKLPKAILTGDAEGNGIDDLTGHGDSQPRKPWWKLVLKLVFFVGKGLLICLPRIKDIESRPWYSRKESFQ